MLSTFLFPLCATSFRHTSINHRAFSLRSFSMTASDKKTFALTYKYVPDILEKRGPFREAHLKLANDLEAEGVILSGGPFLEGTRPVGALFVFHCPNKSIVENFIKSDPYVQNKLVPSFEIREWSVLVGKVISGPTSKL